MSTRLESIVHLARRLVRIVRAIVIGRVRVSDEPIHRDGPPPRIVRMAVVAAPTRPALPESMWEPESRAPYRDDEGQALDEQYALAREAVVASLRSCGYDDRGHHGYGVAAFRALTRSAFKEHTELACYRAETACRGALLTAQGQRIGVSARGLFEGTWAHAQKWASEELLDWWEHGEPRLTYQAYCDDLMRSAFDEYREMVGQ